MDVNTRRLVFGGLIVATILVWGVIAYLIIGDIPFRRTAEPLSPTTTPARQAETALVVAPLGPDRFAVTGQGWPATVPVELHLLPPDGPAYWLGTVQTTSTGTFGGEFHFTPGIPTGPGVLLRARAGTPFGQVVRIPFSLMPPTETPIRAASPTPVPTETPTATAPPTASPAPTTTPIGGAAGPACTVRFEEVNVRSDPTVEADVLTRLPQGSLVEPLARHVSGLWIRVLTADGLRGWISTDGLSCNIDVLTLPMVGETPTPSPSPTPSMTPTPTIHNWRGEYFSNDSLSGDPTIVRDDAEITFDWGTDAPAPGLPADNFSVRWTREWRFSAGTYRFSVRVDDGARLYVDGNLVLDTWGVGPRRTEFADVSLSAGTHSLRLEYVEVGGEATAILWWEPLPDSFAGWRGEYFANRSLDGTPVLVRDESTLSFDWAFGAPAPVIPADGFSARWSRDVFFEAGRYRFKVFADDGVRLWVDDELVVDEWHDARATYTEEHTIARGTHRVRAEYFELTGEAGLSVRWERLDQTFEHWKGEYFDNDSLSGSPVLMRDDEHVDFDWDEGSPHPSLPADEFSVRWTGEPSFEDGTYRFTVLSDDGARLFVDGALVLDRWTRGAGRSTVDLELEEGKARLRLEYFEWVGEAKARLSWERLVAPTPTPSLTPAPTATATPTQTPTATPTMTPTPTATPPPTATPDLEATTIPLPPKSTPVPPIPPAQIMSSVPEISQITAMESITLSGQVVPFTTVVHGNDGFTAIDEPTVTSFTEEEVWDQFLRRHAERLARGSRPVEWERDIVLGVFYGAVPADIAQLTVREIRLDGDTLQVLVRVTGTQFRSPTTAYPAHVVRLTRDIWPANRQRATVRVLTQAGDLLGSTEVPLKK